MDKKLLEKPENYYNRELSWLQFNYRILNEAKDKTIPLFERIKFLSITASNLDEFFMIRVASLIDMVHAGYTKKDLAGLTPSAQLDLIIPETKNMMNSQYSTLNRSLIPALEASGLKLVKRYEDLTEKQAKYVDKYFEKEVYPVLTPMAVDSSRPFPLIRNKTLNIGAILKIKSSLTIYEEYFMIRLCKTQKICIFILGLMLIFGMCSDTSKTDSYFCVVPHSEHSDSDILYNNTRTELTLCTPEALNNSGKNTPENLISRYIIRRNNTAKSFYWLCPSLILPSKKDYFSDYSVNFFYTQKMGMY